MIRRHPHGGSRALDHGGHPRDDGLSQLRIKGAQSARQGQLTGDLVRNRTAMNHRGGQRHCRHRIDIARHDGVQRHDQMLRDLAGKADFMRDQHHFRFHRQGRAMATRCC